jgi:hypothetical protein
MKSIVWGLVFLIAVVSASASYLPQPGIIFEYKGANCFANGSITINLTHEGNNIPFKKINLTVESDQLPPQPLYGRWYIGEVLTSYYEPPADNYTGDNYVNKKRFKYKTTTDMYTKGDYTITLSWPSNTIYYDKIKFGVSCPGKPCQTNDQCILQQACVNSTCEWVQCKESDFAMGHTCLPKCNDYDPCTNDYFTNEQCVYVKINDCKVDKETGKVVTPTNIFARFWNWLKNKY